MDRYVNVTMIDNEGQTTSTQIWTDSSDSTTMKYIEEYVSKGLSDKWYRPFIAAYAFDTKAKTLRQFKISASGKIREV